MNALHLISSGGLYGAEQLVLTLAKEARVRDGKPVIAALDNEHNPHLEILETAQSQGIPTCRIVSRGAFDIGAVYDLRDFVRENGIELIHTHNYKSDVIGWWAARLCKIPVIATAHGYTAQDLKVRIYESADRFLLRRGFSRVVVVDENVFPNLNGNKSVHIPNAVDVEKFSGSLHFRTAERKKHGFDETHFVIGSVGRLSAEKNQIRLLEAASRLKKEFPQIRVLIAGEGPEEAALKDFVEAKGLDENVVFTGFISDMAKVYAVLDLFVMTSTREGLPISLLEAMAAKVPAVAAPAGGIPKLIEDGKTGVLINGGRENSLEESLADLIRDPDKRKALADAAFEFVKEAYSAARMYERYQQVYEDVLAEVSAKSNKYQKPNQKQTTKNN